MISFYPNNGDVQQSNWTQELSTIYFENNGEKYNITFGNIKDFVGYSPDVKKFP